MSNVSNSIMLCCIIMLIQLCSSCICSLSFNLSVKVIVQCVLVVVFGAIVFITIYHLEVVVNVKSTMVLYKLGAIICEYEM